MIDDNVMEPSLDELIERLEDVSASEKKFKTMRENLQAEIVARVGVKAEGTTKFIGGSYTVKTTGKTNRSIDQEAVKALYEAGEVPAPLLNRVFPRPHKLDLTQMRYVENNEPEWFKKISAAITSKPGKASLEIKAL